MRGCRPLTDPEISRLLDLLAVPAWCRERTLILLGIRTGLRLTSMLSLWLADVTVAGEVQNRIRVRRSTVKGKRAGFDMPLHPQSATALQDHIDTLPDRSPDVFLFRGRRPGTRLSKTAGCRAIKRAFRAAGIVGAPTEICTHTERMRSMRRFSEFKPPAGRKSRIAFDGNLATENGLRMVLIEEFPEKIETLLRSDERH